MTSIICEFHLDAAHRLTKVPPDHKCFRLHGHTYRIQVEVGGPIDKQRQWIIDYAEIEAAWMKQIHAKFDHRSLNDAFDRGLETTSENLAGVIGTSMQLALPELKVSKVTVWETAFFGAVWTAGC